MKHSAKYEHCGIIKVPQPGIAYLLVDIVTYLKDYDNVNVTRKYSFTHAISSTISSTMRSVILFNKF